MGRQAGSASRPPSPSESVGPQLIIYEVAREYTLSSADASQVTMTVKVLATGGRGILLGKLKQIKTKTRRKLKDILDFFLYFLVQRTSKLVEICAKCNRYEQLSEFSWNSGKIP